MKLKQLLLNYSNCPLKKRPIKYDDGNLAGNTCIDSSGSEKKSRLENGLNFTQLQKTPSLEVDYSEPENLSTKPEDLRLTKSDYSQVQVQSNNSTNSSLPNNINTNTRILQLPNFESSPIPSSRPFLSSSQIQFPTTIQSQSQHGQIRINCQEPASTLPVPTFYQQQQQQQLNYYHYNQSQFAPQQHLMDYRYLQSMHHHEPSYELSNNLLQISSNNNNYSRSRSLSSGSCESGSDRSSPISDSSLSPTSSTTDKLISIRSATGPTSTRYQCPDCQKSYSTFSGLTKHVKFHCVSSPNSIKSYSCQHCEKMYTSVGALKMHIRTHTLPCKCTICGKAFSRPWLLQGHVRTHTGEKPFSCDFCHRAFADRSNLRAHLQTHSEIKKYSCQFCSKTFSRASLLAKHKESGCGNSSD